MRGHMGRGELVRVTQSDVGSRQMETNEEDRTHHKTRRGKEAENAGTDAPGHTFMMMRMQVLTQVMRVPNEGIESCSTEGLLKLICSSGSNSLTSNI